ncbi:hypothetical protein RIR_jg8990.t1 [Rhizophagus irregularis DAOM 181602=DAOM 197198]|nr:hypothetical protein RIR_jg8990.t1 [Rhizophagus irregularis DAOM 181602=DAOM 197198]
MGDVTYNVSVTDDGLDESSEDEPDKDEDNIILGLQIPNPVDEMPPILPDKAHKKPKTKNTLDKKKSGKTGNIPVSNQSKKKDKQQSSTKASKNNNELKNLTIQKKTKKFPKNGGGGNKDNSKLM